MWRQALAEAEKAGWRIEAGQVYGPDGKKFCAEIPRNWTDKQEAEFLYWLSQEFSWICWEVQR